MIWLNNVGSKAVMTNFDLLKFFNTEYNGGHAVFGHFLVKKKRYKAHLLGVQRALANKPTLFYSN